MAAKTIKFDSEAREAIRRGVAKLAKRRVSGVGVGAGGARVRVSRGRGPRLWRAPGTGAGSAESG